MVFYLNKMEITDYKQILRKHGISHRIVSLYIGHTRESTTLWLNGTLKLPKLNEKHIIRELENLIETRQGFESKKLFNKFIEEL